MLTKVDICPICHKPVDTTAPHAVVKWEYTHLACADEYDGRDLGAIEHSDNEPIRDPYIERGLNRRNF